MIIVNCFLERHVQILCVIFKTFSLKALVISGNHFLKKELIFVIFIYTFLERTLRTTGGGARAGVRQGQRQLLGGDGLLCERLHLGNVEIMTMLTNFLSKSFKP